MMEWAGDGPQNLLHLHFASVMLLDYLLCEIGYRLLLGVQKTHVPLQNL